MDHGSTKSESAFRPPDDHVYRAMIIRAEGSKEARALLAQSGSIEAGFLSTCRNVVSSYFLEHFSGDHRDETYFSEMFGWRIWRLDTPDALTYAAYLSPDWEFPARELSVEFRDVVFTLAFHDVWEEDEQWRSRSLCIAWRAGSQQEPDTTQSQDALSVLSQVFDLESVVGGRTDG